MENWLVHRVLSRLKNITDENSPDFSEIIHNRVNDWAGACYNKFPGERKEQHWYSALTYLGVEMTFALGSFIRELPESDDLSSEIEREVEFARTILIPECASSLTPRGDERELALSVLPCARI